MKTPLVTREVADLVPYTHKSRTHSEGQIAQIAASISEFGFTNPVLIDEKDTIIAGEGRVLAAKTLKKTTVPCIVVSGLTDAQKAAYLIADNKLTLNAGWNEDMLRAEFSRLAELQYDVNLTGFSEVEIATLLKESETNEFDDVDDVGDAGDGGAGKQDPAGDWKEMPDFHQPDAGPFRTITVHFKDQASVDAFAKLIGQNLTDKTKWVWYPEVVKVAAAKVYA